MLYFVLIGTRRLRRLCSCERCSSVQNGSSCLRILCESDSMGRKLGESWPGGDNKKREVRECVSGSKCIFKVSKNSAHMKRFSDCNSKSKKISFCGYNMRLCSNVRNYNTQFKVVPCYYVR